MQPGSDGAVLANKLHITNPDEMEEAELVLLEKLYEAVLVDDLPMRPLTVDDMVRWHRQWLGNVYAWAGEFRSVNASKGGFMFAAAAQVPRLLTEFGRDCLTRYTPATGGDAVALAEAIAITHAELVLIHPFVEGNGRMARRAGGRDGRSGWTRAAGLQRVGRGPRTLFRRDTRGNGAGKRGDAGVGYAVVRAGRLMPLRRPA